MRTFAHDVIWNALSRVVQAETPISIRAVQKELGVSDIRGSAGIIAEVIRDWVDEFAAHEPVQMPTAVQSALSDWVWRAGAERWARNVPPDWQSFRADVFPALCEWVRQEAENLKKTKRGREGFLADIEREARELATGRSAARRRKTGRCRL